MGDPSVLLPLQFMQRATHLLTKTVQPYVLATLHIMLAFRLLVTNGAAATRLLYALLDPVCEVGQRVQRGKRRHRRHIDLAEQGLDVAVFARFGGQDRVAGVGAALAIAR